MKIIFTAQNIVFTKKFLKDFKKITPNEQSFIKKKLSNSFRQSEKLPIKKLKNYPLAQYRIRIKNFRLLFSYDEKKQLFVFSHCKHRKDLY